MASLLAAALTAKEAGNYTEALALLTIGLHRASRETESDSVHRRLAEMHTVRAELFHMFSMAPNALYEGWRVAELQPENTTGWELIGRACLELCLFNDAVRALERGASLGMDDALLAVARGKEVSRREQTRALVTMDDWFRWELNTFQYPLQLLMRPSDLLDMTYFDYLTREEAYVEVRSDNNGRGLFARKDIPCNGQSFTPFFFEDAFAVGSIDDSVCIGCLNCVDSNGIKCDSCDSKYCSLNCIDAYRTTHNILCGKLADFNAGTFKEPSFRRTAHLLAHLLAITMQRPNWPTSTLDMPEITHLASYVDCDAVCWAAVLRDMDQHTRIFQLLRLSFGLQDCLFVDFHWYLHLYLVLRINTFALPTGPSDPHRDQGGSGSGLFRVASMANHACLKAANAIYLTEGKRVTFLATREISKGDEILIAYQQDEDGDARRRSLQRQYGFKCTCLQCELEPSSTVL